MPDVSNWTEDNPVYDDSQTQFTPTSRIHKHKSTEPSSSVPSSDSGQSTVLDSDELPSKLDRIIEREHTPELRPLSVRGDLDLRAETVSEETEEAHDWSTVTSLYRRWLDGYTGDRRGSLLLEDSDGNELRKPASVRFDSHRAKKEYARLHNLHQGLEKEFENLHIAMISLTGSSRNDRGGLRCPADHLADLDKSRDAVMASLRRQLSNRRFCTAWILEPHKSGYVHRHLVVFVEGAVSRSTFRPLVDSHLRNCPVAGSLAHQYENCIDVKDVDREASDAVNSIAYYLTEYIADSFGDPQDTPEHVERFNALLWATGKRRVGYSQNAYEYIDIGYELHTGQTKNSSEDSGWRLVGYVDADGDVHKVEPEGSRGVSYVSPSSLSPQLLDPRGDPPPDEPVLGSP